MRPAPLLPWISVVLRMVDVPDGAYAERNNNGGNMKVIARLISAALAIGALSATPAYATEGDPLAAWNNALANTDTGQANIVWLGSSSTYGVGATTPDKRYTHLATAALGGGAVTHVGDSYPGRNTSPGVHGYVSAPGGANSQNYITDANRPWILWERPSLIVHMVGSNDSVDREPFMVPIDEYETSMGEQVDKLDAASPRPISHLLVHTYRRFDVTAAKWATYGEALERVADARDNVAFLDVSQVYEAADIYNGDPDDLIYDADALHPSDAGHALMAGLVAAELGVEAPVEPEPEPVEPAPVPAPVAPEPPPMTPAVVEPITPPATVVLPDAPSQPSSVKATRRGKVVKVRWQKATGADTYRVRCGGKTKTANGTRTKMRSTSKRCRVQAVNVVGVSGWKVVRVKKTR